MNKERLFLGLKLGLLIVLVYITHQPIANSQRFNKNNAAQRYKEGARNSRTIAALR
ncbi:MAG: hypothetical protein WCE21_03395 [Candidatus Babeliales bacterium]